MMLARPDFAGFLKFTSLSMFGGLCTYYLMNPVEKKPVSAKNVVVTTGCDSGLGYSLAIYCHDKLSMNVVACVHQLSSAGATKLKQMFGSSKRFHIIELEVKEYDSVQTAQKFVENLLEKDHDLELTALINNCGVMCFGEAEWQTDKIFEHQIDVNLTGSIRVTKNFLPLIRKHKSRIINVTSHCGLRALPGLSVYGATKAALINFNDSLRMEMKKYDVDVVNFIPGSFVGSSNIASHQRKHAEEMRNAMSENQLHFYGEYFDRYNKYLDVLSVEKEPQMVSDENILETFADALLDLQPKSCYVCEPWRYKMYHFLFKISPHRSITDWLIYKFISMPQFDRATVKNL